MSYSFLDVLEEEYANAEMTFLKDSNKDAEECEEFYSKYIEPLFSKNNTIARKIEDNFFSVIGAQQEKSFKDGFKACMQMLLECASEKAVKL